MLIFFKKIFGIKPNTNTISINNDIVIKEDLSQSTKKDFIGKLDRIYFDKSNPIGSNISTVQFKTNDIIKRVQLQVDKKLSGSTFKVYQKNIFGDVIGEITNELDLTKFEQSKNNFLSIETNNLINETSIISIEQLGSGKGSGILYIEYYELEK